MNESMTEWMNEWMNGWMYWPTERMQGLTRCMDGLTAWMDGWMGGCIDWMNGCIYWLDGWIHCLDRWMYALNGSLQSPMFGCPWCSWSPSWRILPATCSNILPTCSEKHQWQPKKSSKVFSTIGVFFSFRYLGWGKLAPKIPKKSPRRFQ